MKLMHEGSRKSKCDEVCTRTSSSVTMPGFPGPVLGGLSQSDVHIEKIGLPDSQVNSFNLTTETAVEHRSLERRETV